jgi:hypothetical protein
MVTPQPVKIQLFNTSEELSSHNSPCHSWSAEALPGIDIAGLIVRTNRVAVAKLAPLAASYVEETVFALVTIFSNDVRLAVARTSDPVASE